MARFRVFLEDQPLKTYDLQEPVITIGRLPDNTIPISNMGISRRHVKIEEDSDDVYILSDLNSLNGTNVNGEKIKKVTLSHGDKITIGKYTIIYECQESEVLIPVQENPVDPLDFQPVVEESNRQPAREAETVVPLTAVKDKGKAPPDQEEAAVLIETGKHVVYKLGATNLTIGADENDDIFADGFMINKAFATVEKRDEGNYIFVNKMVGKIKVNGKLVRSHLLTHKDRIEIGNNTFRYMENG